MYGEDELLPLSALQHLLYCERQCAFIHVERLWVENRYTAEGRLMHDRVHQADLESRGKVRIEYGAPLRSLSLGLVGQADVIEFHKVKDAQGKGSMQVWRPFPVEYKRGKAKKENWDRVQICAQAICLEEMLNIEVSQGALFYGKTRRRRDVTFDDDLRNETTETAKRLHSLIASNQTPKPIYNKKCDRCSFLEVCLPKAIDSKKSAKLYLKKVIEGI